MNKRVMNSLTALIFCGAVAGNVLIVANNLSIGSVWVHILCAASMAIIAFKDYSDPKNFNKWDVGRKNIQEAQRLLREKPYGVFRYATRKMVFGHEAPPNYSFDGILEEPLVWFFCLALYAALFYTPAYFDFDINDMRMVIELTFYSVIQLVLLTATIFGLLNVATRKFRGDK